MFDLKQFLLEPCLPKIRHAQQKGNQPPPQPSKIIGSPQNNVTFSISPLFMMKHPTKAAYA